MAACQPANNPQQTPAVTATPKKSATATPKASPSPTLAPTTAPPWWLPPEALTGTKITFVHPWSGELAQKMATLIHTFNQTNEWGISATVYGLGSAQQVFQQSEAGIQVGDAPQVVIAAGEELAYSRQHGSLLPLDQFVENKDYGLPQEIIADYYPLFWQQDVLDGQRLGIPAARNAHFLLYNTTWAKELGFKTPPQKPAQFMAQVCAARDYVLKDDNWQNNGTGGWIIDRREYTLLGWLHAFGIADFPQAEQPYAFNQPATLETFTFLHQLSDDTCAWQSRDPSPYEYFANREALLVSADLGDLTPQTNILTIAQTGDSWTVIPYPSVSSQPAIIISGSSYGILRSTKAQELASWLLIRWLNEPLQQKQLARLNPNLPVSRSLLQELSAARSPQWAAVVNLLEGAQPAPSTAEWRVGRFVLPDAAYQIFLPNTTPEQFPEIIRMLDATILALAAQPAATGWQ